MRKIKHKKYKWAKCLPLMLACFFGYYSTAAAENVSPNGTSSNSIEINDENYDVVYGGGNEESSEDAIDNRIKVNGGELGGVLGGVAASGNVEGNEITINDGNIEGVTGGLSVVNSDLFNASGNVSNNKVIIHGGTIQFVSGGEVAYTYSINGSSDLTAELLRLGNGNVFGNSVKVDGGTIGDIRGGAALSGDAFNNTIEISGGTINGSIIGGMSESGNAYGNTIDISGAPDIGNAVLIGGLSSSGNVFGNTLNIKGVSGLNVRSIEGFDKLGFELPTEGDTILNITGGARTELTGTTIEVGSRGDNARVDTGLTLNLIRNSNGITGSNIQLPNTLKKGVSFEYEVYLEDDAGNPIASRTADDLASSADVDDGNFTATGFRARVGNKIGGIKEKTGNLVINGDPPIHRTVVETIDDNNNHWKPPEDEFREIQDQDEEISNEMKIFAGVNGSSLRTKLSDGGHINNKTIGFGLGGSKTLVNKTNGDHFSFAPIIDHGKGKFDTYTSNGNHGNGDTQFSAGGFIARKMHGNGFYYEGSLRYGRAKSSFESNDFEPTATGETYATYDMSAPIIAGHINIGKIFAINKTNAVHVYGQYLHAHQGSMSADLSSGEHYEFDSVNDGSFVAGIRFINQPNRVNKFYSGFAYQYDHSTGSSAVCEGESTHEVDSNGGSGMFELGWEIKPHAAVPWVVDLGAVGWVGQQKGLTFHAKVKKAF